jgi:hypothetical protein
MNEFSEGLKKESSEELVEKKPNISKPPKIDLYDEFVKMTTKETDSNK